MEMSKEAAVFQGGFILANKMCHPASLAALQKCDWKRVEHPVLETVRELCGREDNSAACWRKKFVCIVWLKLLCTESKEDMETAWRENPFFAVLSGLPEVNHVVLMELVKSVAAADIFAQFLLRLPEPQICAELERLTQHVKCSPIEEADIWLFLEVWWELWKGRDEQKAGAEDGIEAVFANQYTRLSSESISLSPQAAKRQKLDPSDLKSPSMSSPTSDVLFILLNALNDIKQDIHRVDLSLTALSVCLDALYTSFLINKSVVLPVKHKMSILSEIVSIKQNDDEKLSPDLLREAQRDLHASSVQSEFQLSTLTFSRAFKVVTELAQFWQSRNLLQMEDCSAPSYPAFKLRQSVQRVLAALEGGDQQVETNELRGVLQVLSFPPFECSPEVHKKVVTTIISHRLEDYNEFAVLFASEKSWACDDIWVNCLEKNQAVFQQHVTLDKLVCTLMSKFNSEHMNVIQCRKLIKVSADIFSALSLEDKNKALGAMLSLSSKGFFGCAIPALVCDGFEKELNMAFNCIIQGGGGSSAAAAQGSLNTATALVARVAFQNPEATLRACCHSAVFNKGAFGLMARILQQLPGLGGSERKHVEENTVGNLAGSSGAAITCSLLCRCLHEVTRARVMSVNDQEQFIKFIDVMMTPAVTADGGEPRRGFLSPQEVVKTLVLPNLSAAGHSNINMDVSLQVLLNALCVDLQEPVSTPPWIRGCFPFPLLYVLAQLYNQMLRCWEQTSETSTLQWSMDIKELLTTVLTTLGQVLGAVVASDPSSWSRALFWLYNKMEELDWTIRFYLKPIWGEHFKNEVPSSLLTVCDLPEQEWSGCGLPQYGPGTGLLAWMECCSISDSLQSTMLRCLALDRTRPDHVGMFSKGLLVALTQVLPWCSISQWTRVLRTLRQLLLSGLLHVPFSLEYVDYLPLLDLKRFSCELRLSVLLLRVLQLLCGSSCSHWLSVDGWGHVGRLYAHAVKDMMTSLKAKLPLPTSGTLNAIPEGCAASIPKTQTPRDTRPPASNNDCTASADTTEGEKVQLRSPDVSSTKPQMEDEVQMAPSQEVLFVLSQLFCHVQHIQVMMPGGQCEPLFLSSLEILSHYEAVMAAFPESSSALDSDNTRHFFSTITDNLKNQDMKAVLQQKISQLVSSAA